MSSFARMPAQAELGALGAAASGRAAALAARLDRRAAAAAALAAFLLLPLGLSDGGYYARSTTALMVALAAVCGIALLARFALPLSLPFIATAGALGLLVAWTALSSAWARDGSMVEAEARRGILYATALIAVGAVVNAARRGVFLLALTGGVVALAVVGIAMRVVSGLPSHPYFGSLLAEPVGYSNAMGVLVAIATVLAVGLGTSLGGGVARLGRGIAPLLVLVLGLTGSRGGALALGVGLIALVLLAGGPGRWSLVGLGALAVAVGGGAWVLTAAAGGAGPTLALAAVGAIALGAVVPAPGRRLACALLCSLTVAAGVVVVLDPPSTTSSFRSAYWAAALEEARARPLLGSGAGSFHLTWSERRSEETHVRDAHSLYVETLSELGPVGLALVVSLVAVPLAAAARGRGDPLTASAGAAFVVFAVHAGLDWDWEMPVVTLTGLGCAAAVLVGGQSRRTPATEKGGK